MARLFICSKCVVKFKCFLSQNSLNPWFYATFEKVFNFLYKTNVFNGIENEESKWIPLSNIHDYKLISGLNDVLEVFEGTKYNELYYNAQYQLKKY